MASHLALLDGFWRWLTTGQNAAGVQTITTVLATIGALAAAVFTGLAYRSAKSQTQAALDQAKEARAQTQLARESAEAQRVHYKEEQRRREEAAKLAHERQIAEENTLRPRLGIGTVGSPEGLRLQLVNIGLTPMTKLRVTSFITKQALGNSELLAPTQSTQLTVDSTLASEEGIEFRYQGPTGTVWGLLWRYTRGQRELDPIRLSEST